MADQEATTNSEVVKRQCKWNSQHQTTNSPVSAMPKDAFPASMKHRFSKSDSSVSHEGPKERVGELFYLLSVYETWYDSSHTFSCLFGSSSIIKGSNHFS